MIVNPVKFQKESELTNEQIKTVSSAEHSWFQWDGKFNFNYLKTRKVLINSYVVSKFTFLLMKSSLPKWEKLQGT